MELLMNSAKFILIKSTIMKVAVKELVISKLSFDEAWVSMVIESKRRIIILETCYSSYFGRKGFAD